LGIEKLGWVSHVYPGCSAGFQATQLLWHLVYHGIHIRSLITDRWKQRQNDKSHYNAANSPPEYSFSTPAQLPQNNI
jgi:hypothetical protein